MPQTDEYEPPKKWDWSEVEGKNGGTFAKINRPFMRPTHERQLPVGEHPLQLHSLATPNGVKVTIMLEELLELGHSGAEYDAYPVNILEGEQFSSGFLELNPNGKIPALFDRSGKNPIRLFESGSILLYLAEKFGELLPRDVAGRTECLNWLFWQTGAAPFLGGGFGHFFAYAPKKLEYPIDRFTIETKRELDLLDQRLAESEYLGGPDYSIADIASYPWYGLLVDGQLYDAAEFLDVKSYKNIDRWQRSIASRPAVRRGRLVNRTWGDVQLPERHSADDFRGLLPSSQ